jgi:hypothetical protein
MPLVRSWLSVVAALFLGCAGSRGPVNTPSPSSPFLESDKALFEDGVDLIADPEGLSGRWAEDWSRELHDRVERSDLIALLTVNTLSTDVSPEQSSTHRLVADVGDVLKGKYQGELALASSEDSIGFDSVDRERGNILKRPLIVFAKWVRDDVGVVRPRWHLAVGSKSVVDAVRLEIAGERPDSQTVIEHSH